MTAGVTHGFSEGRDHHSIGHRAGASHDDTRAVRNAGDVPAVRAQRLCNVGRKRARKSGNDPQRRIGRLQDRRRPGDLLRQLRGQGDCWSNREPIGDEVRHSHDYTAPAGTVGRSILAGIPVPLQFD